MKKKISIAIDGPAAAGKSTVAKLVAESLSYIYIDTGAMYRAITYKALKQQIDLDNEKLLHELLLQTSIELTPGKVGQVIYLDGENVTSEIRTAEVSNSVSFVSRHPLVREELVKRQQALGASGGVVMDGRDIGTHVLPNAEVKVFLVASVEERAKRRHAENLTKGFPSDIQTLREEISTRDKLDSEREVSPLKKADDAVQIDTSSLTIGQVVDKIMDLVRERVGML